MSVGTVVELSQMSARTPQHFSTEVGLGRREVMVVVVVSVVVVLWNDVTGRVETWVVIWVLTNVVETISVEISAVDIVVETVIF